MAGKFPSRGEFTIPSELIDEHEWMSDFLIDSYGAGCRVEYPPVDSECINCFFDPFTGRSNNMYKSGGPVPFANNTICPVCGGVGRSIEASYSDILVRYYSDSRDWVKLEGVNFVTGDGIAQIIGYMNDVPKLSRATSLIISTGVDGIKTWRYEMASDCLPWGFRGDRYFGAFIKRVK